MAWVQIMASPFLVGLVGGGIVYLAMRNTAGLIIGIVIASGGLLTGIIWATRVWRKKGTVNFMSRVMATPELNEKGCDD